MVSKVPKRSSNSNGDDVIYAIRSRFTDYTFIVLLSVFSRVISPISCVVHRRIYSNSFLLQSVLCPSGSLRLRWHIFIINTNIRKYRLFIIYGFVGTIISSHKIGFHHLATLAKALYIYVCDLCDASVAIYAMFFYEFLESIMYIYIYVYNII